jgi:mRNA interferase MazF
VVGVTVVHTGEVWLAQFDPIVGHEQGGRRPVVIVSSDDFHTLPIYMAIVVPLTGTDRGLVTQPEVASSSAGLIRRSFSHPEDVRAVDTARMLRRLGEISAGELADIRKVLRYFLDL